MKRLLWTLTLALLLPSGVAGQAAENPLRIWAAAGLGGGGGLGSSQMAGKTEGMIAIGELVGQKAPHQVMVRGLLMVDPMSDGASYGAGELGVLYGRTITTTFAHVGVAAGLALTGFDSCVDPYDSCQFPGVPLVAEAALTPFAILGVGLQVFANLNRHTSYAGVAVMVQLGWLP